ncbi:hypothetical protein [Nafulsella turpanensis]|uniref:hypothetical protein n=1 Tax=Nafulsella turpanensis TaxID=1265690 RepID=UPI0003485592|nr:hypothetical protein [Nafulsella turpanensis]
MKNFLISCTILLASLSSCNESGAPEETIELAENKKEEIFHQQEHLETGDSLEVKILSWGGKSIGSYLLLMADSARQRYIGDSFFRKGTLENSWISDLDEDGWPEVGVVVQEKENNGYAKLQLHELTGDFSIRTINLPPLSEALGADYGGHDSIYLKGGRIVRDFRRLNRADSLPANMPPAGRRVVYDMENNSLVIAEFEELPVK